MEISRHLKPSLNLPSDAPAQVQSARPQPGGNARTSVSQEPRLEQLQDALRSLLDVDLEKVAQLKAALARGELSSDPAALAGSMLTYHSGSDA
ncbi:flagellar biosynthesis anti-sigma factor FlgM [Ectopseudomonas toyotomiensis]|uniref:Negative regulator of flagellin synthesis n=1 Tax=Ectopseudomonas toyotomiensis TaxID=554344 RepID=A0AA42LJH6_9GAMM|nr:flagellar biosynthesis anti-sigma factor FlgM [Pseudomonas toyotomiensis]MBG0842492.1 flagellar biosynthesis anti-sigma factor FlgM [Pseudomonas toyotomiensis]MDH0703294.1 flagellar biosynthesis anti-sigma factor FlgM [Pseudomonas toyotomiensis]